MRKERRREQGYGKRFWPKLKFEGKQRRLGATFDGGKEKNRRERDTTMEGVSEREPDVENRQIGSTSSTQFRFKGGGEDRRKGRKRIIERVKTIKSKPML